MSKFENLEEVVKFANEMEEVLHRQLTNEEWSEIAQRNENENIVIFEEVNKELGDEGEWVRGYCLADSEYINEDDGCIGDVNGSRYRVLSMEDSLELCNEFCDFDFKMRNN